MTTHVTVSEISRTRVPRFRAMAALFVVAATMALAAWLAPTPATAAVNIGQFDAPSQITTTSAFWATMGIPRWKAYMSGEHNYKLWITIAGHSSSANNVYYSKDRGSTWSAETINPNINGYLDYHVALYGSADGLCWTFPSANGLGFRHMDYPAESNEDRGPVVFFDGTESGHRATVMVESSGRIWVFSRNGDNSNENVKFNYSDNKGQTWQSGVAVDANWEDVRVGSMPYVDGAPCLVVLYTQNARGFEYYLWSGSEFVRHDDSSIFAENMGHDRAFTHNVVEGEFFHLIFGEPDELQHVWKSFAGGKGSWNVAPIDFDPDMGANDWQPISCVYRNYLFVFYVMTDASGDFDIYMKYWNQNDEVWSDRMLVSAPVSSNNMNPNTCMSLPAGADYVPVFWTSGPNGESVMYNKLDLIDDTASAVLPGGPEFEVSTTPNPTSSVVRLGFAGVPHTRCDVEIFDLRGRLVFRSEQAIQDGQGSVLWNGHDLNGDQVPSGQYYLRATAGTEVQLEKLTVLR